MVLGHHRGMDILTTFWSNLNMSEMCHCNRRLLKSAYKLLNNSIASQFQESKKKEAQRMEDENFGSHCLGKVRTFLWNLMEYPETSRYAQVIITPHNYQAEYILWSRYNMVHN